MRIICEHNKKEFYFNNIATNEIGFHKDEMLHEFLKGNL